MSDETELRAEGAAIHDAGRRAGGDPGAVPSPGTEGRPTGADDDIVRRMLRREVLAIDAAVASANIEQCVASLTQRGIAAELVQQQYVGRYPLELLQNASDAAARTHREDPGRPRVRVRFVLTHNALVVANMGECFRDDDVRAICEIGQTSKDPRETIGYKGLGFKSVGEITDTPQILSGRHRFTFDARRARQEVEQRLGSKPARLRVPAYAFPFPLDLDDLGEDRGLVEDCAREGYVTVLRLPLKPGVDREEVARDLAEMLSPRLLLLLESVDVLIVEGIERPFSVERDRSKRSAVTHVVLQIDDAMLEDWLLFERSVDIPSSDLVRGLGDGWANVTKIRVAVAVPLVDHKPDPTGSHPLHVYFPTEDTAGFAFIVHADFALDMDRRHVSQTQEAKPYNGWLLKEVVRFLTEDIVEALGRDYGAAPSAIAVLAPDDPSSPFTRRLRDRYIAALRSSEFIPTVDGSRLMPAEARLLPDSVGDPVEARSHLDLSTLRNLVKPEVQAIARARRLLRVDLDVKQLTTEATLGMLPTEPPSPNGFYEWLNRWANAEGLEAFARLLRGVACVCTTTRSWVRPSKEVYFPRERGAPALPEDLPLQIAHVPDAARLLLQAAGVSPFRWRDIVLQSICRSSRTRDAPWNVAQAPTVRSAPTWRARAGTMARSRRALARRWCPRTSPQGDLRCCAARTRPTSRRPGSTETISRESTARSASRSSSLGCCRSPRTSERASGNTWSGWASPPDRASIVSQSQTSKRTFPLARAPSFTSGSARAPRPSIAQ